MLLTDYTTPDEIRAVLGVESDELSDATLDLRMYASAFAIELNAISSTLAADHATISAEDESVRTAIEQRVFDAMAAFAPYAVAKALAPALPLFAPKQVTDGKASVTRDSASPYNVTLAGILAQYDYYRGVLSDTYTEYKTGTAPSLILRPFVVGSTPSTDPVTG